MFQRYKWISIIAVIVLLSGIMPNVVDASASVGSDEGKQDSNQPIYQQQDHQYTGFDKFLQECFERWGINWEEQENNNQSQEEQPEQIEQPEQPEQPEVNQPQPTPEQPAEEPSSEDETNELSQFEQQVVELTNQERAKHGLSELQIDNELSRVAREKSRDMQINNYFDHNSPTYGSPFDMMQSYGIDYRAAGENIAKGQRSPEEVVDGWMNSEGHRANILNGSFTHIGVGYIEQGNYWTQQFIGK